MPLPAVGEFKLTVNAPVIALTPRTLPAAQVRAKYKTTRITGTGGVGAYMYKATGPLPAGMKMTTHGTMYGRPTRAGTYRFTVTAIDASGYKGTRKYSVRIR